MAQCAPVRSSFLPLFQLLPMLAPMGDKLHKAHEHEQERGTQRRQPLCRALAEQQPEPQEQEQANARCRDKACNQERRRIQRDWRRAGQVEAHRFAQVAGAVADAALV